MQPICNMFVRRIEDVSKSACNSLIDSRTVKVTVTRQTFGANWKIVVSSCFPPSHDFAFFYLCKIYLYTNLDLLVQDRFTRVNPGYSRLNIMYISLRVSL